MFGEYGLFCDGKMIATIGNDQLFIKLTTGGRALAEGAKEISPYPEAKPCLLIDADRWEALRRGPGRAAGRTRRPAAAVRTGPAPPAAWSRVVPDMKIALHTRDGECPTHVMTPEGAGPWPATIMYMDAGGIRPAMLDMAQRLADVGYIVLLPDLFYRFGSYGPFVPAEVFKGNVRAILGPLMATTGPDKAAADTGALLEYLDTRGDVSSHSIGAVGFCMGGGMAIAAAAAFPDRLAVVASFHGGNLATDTPVSPHLGAPQLKAEVYIAAAENDESYPPEMADRLEHALADAGVRFRSETYPAAHGWMMPDFPVYDHDAAERGWSELNAAFGRAFR